VEEIIRIFSEISKDSRPEIITILEETPGIRALLREKDLIIPIRLSVMVLCSIFSDLKDFFNRNRQEVLLEIKGLVLSRKNPERSYKEGFISILSRKIENSSEKFFSWLKCYFPRKETPLIESFKLCNEIYDIYKGIFNDIYVYGNISVEIQRILLIIAKFPDKLCEINMEFVLFSPDYEEKNLRNLKWMMELIQNINKYHDKNWFEAIKTGENREENPLESSQLQALISHENLRKYSKNLLSPVSQCFSRVFLRLLSRNSPIYSRLLEKLHFSEFFLGFLKQQYNLLKDFMKNQTEDIQIIENYVEEANFRLKVFESLLSGNSDILKKPFIESDFCHYLTGNLCIDIHGFDLELFKIHQEFLPFRQFLPLRNEGLTILTSILWNKAKNPGIYKELLVGISHNKVIERVLKELMMKKEGVIWVSSLFFFSILVRDGDEEVLQLMKIEGVFGVLREVFRDNSKLEKEFPEIARFLKGNKNY